ncbi:sensor histidine kinase [Carnobacterium maltaromaticum]|uniref:sensor histidine kinase n=1 Tax=Carnobacterium maltaromaticum TaxID=2751 RepID=UPI00191BB97C|nr:HAMP domain-containing sensor histidine kinase [Carnobacterium maltaromaticum]CAD5897182.1 conserved hypothetical protein [Carnobacterium maltaromaticum]
MTIKMRFLISYLGGIIVTLLSLFLISSITLFVVTGSVPSPNNLYKMITRERSLSLEEEGAFLELRLLAKNEPDSLKNLENPELVKIIQEIEQQNLAVVIRQGEDISYYSNGLVEKSLLAHFPIYEPNNLKVNGTIDNAGRLYRYMKFDFKDSDQRANSVMVLKKENTFVEFLQKWGLLISGLIILIALIFVQLFNRSITKTIIEPLDQLKKSTETMKTGNLESIEVPLDNEYAANEIKELADSFEEMRLQVKQSAIEQKRYEENRKELIANISHDLKTPITSIIGYVEGLQDGVATTKEKEAQYLATIHKKATSLNHLIEELFLYSKLDLQKIGFNFEEVNIRQFLVHISEEYQMELANQGTHLSTEFGEEQDAYCLIDREQVNRILGNLIQNSLNFRDMGKEFNQVILRLTQTESKVWIEVEDNGIGIDEEQQAFIFDRFYRGESSRNIAMGGSGLGLAIVKQLVEAHGGTLQLNSIKGQGTKIAFCLNKLVEKE